MTSSSSSYAIGIDLGTTYCCIAVVKDPNQAPEIIPSDMGTNTTPSYVAYNLQEAEEDIYAGEAAKNRAIRNPQNVIFDIKRLIGRPFCDPHIVKYKQLWPFDLVDVTGFLGVQVGNQTLFPQVVAKELISHLKKQAEEILGCTINSAVVTVPVYYNEMQKRLTHWACTEAGLEFTEFIAEPVAAAFAYSLWSSIESHESKTCLIYDLGGGTFDVTVFRLYANNQVEIKGRDGNDRLGGEDFNDLITDYCLSEFKKINSINLSEGKTSENDEIRLETAKLLRRIRNDCEEKKCYLSAAQTATVTVDYVHGDVSMKIQVTREIFENLIHDLLKTSIKIMEKTLKECGVEKSGIDEVVLIGGSTRIPKVQQMVEEYFEGRRLLRSVDVDEAVACGAAIHAHNIFKGSGAPLSIVTLMEQTPVETSSVSRVHRQEAVALNVLPKKMRWSNQVHGFPPRWGHAAVAVGNRVYSFGGRNLSGHPTFLRDGPLDVIVLNANEQKMKWKLLSVESKKSNPSQRYFHSAVAYKKFVIIFGGEEAESFARSNTTFRFNTETLKWDAPEVTGKIPDARFLHSAVVIGNQMLVFGGYNFGIKLSHDLHSLDLDTFHWSTIAAKGTAPSLRERHSATVHKDRFMFIFGGYEPETNKRLNDLFCFDAITKEWTRPETSGTTPRSRFGHSAFMHNGLLFVFGGYSNQNSYLNDLYIYIPQTGKWKEVKPTGQPPSPRSSFGCVALNDRVLVFGGWDRDRKALDDTLELEFE